MATIGRNAAVAELPGGITFKGLLAWLLWVFIHIAKLVGFRNRLSALVNWAYNYFTYSRSARLILDDGPASDRSSAIEAQEEMGGRKAPDASASPAPFSKAPS